MSIKLMILHSRLWVRVRHATIFIVLSLKVRKSQKLNCGVFNSFKNERKFYQKEIKALYYISLLKVIKQNKVPFFFWFDHIFGGIFLFILGRMEYSTISFWDLRTFSYLRKKSNAQKFLILFQEKGPFLNEEKL